MQLIGDYTVALDEKGRMRLPSALLRQLSPNQGNGSEGMTYAFVVNRGFEKCLTLYPQPVWDGIVSKLNRLNSFNNRHRAFIRTFYYGVAQLSTDNADRVLIQKALLDYAGITKEAVLMAMIDRIEIWSPEQQQLAIHDNTDSYATLADEVMGGNFDLTDL